MIFDPFDVYRRDEAAAKVQQNQCVNTEIDSE